MARSGVVLAVLLAAQCLCASHRYVTRESLPAQLKPPMLVSTWNFENAGAAGNKVLMEGGSALDAVEIGCTQCEIDQCDTTVGYGGSPDENGETRLDAMIMDGTTMKSGSVSSMRRVKSAISVARAVLRHSQHTMLTGDAATTFATQMGFREEDLSTNASTSRWEAWKANSCQPNFWMNVSPDPATSCGPYSPLPEPQWKTVAQTSERSRWQIDQSSHDTISMVAIDSFGELAAGTSTNGATFKIPGRVGDGPITGSGSYADGDVGGCGSTGDGDIMMRFLPCYQVVESLRRGMSATEAAHDSMRRIARKFPDFQGAVVALSITGDFGASCYGLPNGFPFVVASADLPDVTVVIAPCAKLADVV